MDSSYAKDEVVVAYTDERGDYQNYSGSCDCYNKTDGLPFSVNDNYRGASNCGRIYFLCYDGHPGIDYPILNNTPVYAAADGVAHLPASFPGVSNAQNYNSIEIDHQNGYKTYYLHLSQQVVTDGQSVIRGQLIGYSGDVGSPGAYHLHFEVQKNGIPVDPYGWEGSGSDPYREININLWAKFDNDSDGYPSDVDCDDNDSSVNPGVTEGPYGDPTCNDGKDNDCDTDIDAADLNCKNPDLIVSSLTAPTTAGAGQTISVSDTTKNQGAGSAVASTTKFYLSTNTTYDAGDTYLGERQVPPLAPGTSSGPVNTSVTIPSGTATGSYYIIARADADGDNSETSETNNFKSKSIKIGPDLIVSSIVISPYSPLAGQSVNVTVTVKNQGGGAAGAFQVDIYKHQDTAPPPGLAGDEYCPISSLAAGATTTCVKTVSYAVAGTYKMWAQVDTDQQVSETSETNNTKYKSLTIQTPKPDLIVSSLTAPTTAGAGQTITVSDTTKNQGAGSAVASTTKFYLSTNSTYSAEDTPLEPPRSVPSLAPGASDPGSTNVTIPSNWPTGKSYIIAKADDPSTNDETNENNNTRSKLITIGPDLIVSSIVTSPYSPLAGQNVTVTVTVKNQGGGAAGAFRVDIYKHQDTAPPPGLAGDEYCPISSLAAGATTTCVKPVSYATAGTYKMWAQVDTDQQVAETNETNNTKYKTVTVKP
jgi:subtilase family serine protease